jgi:hypothetical protein
MVLALRPELAPPPLAARSGAQAAPAALRPCPAGIDSVESAYAAQRMVNLMGAWHSQLIEFSEPWASGRSVGYVAKWVAPFSWKKLRKRLLRLTRVSGNK